MKQTYIAFLFSILATATILTACRKDKSSLDVNKIPGVMFDTTGNSSYTVYQFDNLVINPTLLLESGLNEADLSYTWRINLVPMDTVWQVISNERNLDFEMKFKPNSSTYYHRIMYTVTDKKRGQDYIMTWPVTVLNNIGEGLLVAESSDNANTDISHIMAPEVTPGFTKVDVKHGVFSGINNKFIPGIVKQMRFINMYGVNAFIAITDNSMLRVNTLDQVLAGVDNDLFVVPPAAIKPQALGGVYLSDLFVMNNKLIATNLNNNRKIGVPLDYKFSVPAQLVMNPHYDAYQPIFTFQFYDEVNGYFVYLPTLMPFGGDNKMHIYPSVQGKPFDPSSVTGKTNIAAGYTVGGGFLHILKDRNNGKLEAYVFDAGIDNWPDPATIPSPIALWDLSAAPDISNATRFVILDDQKVMYYATSTKIYAMLYGASTPVFQERYEVPAGEQITTLQVYQQAGYPDRDDLLGTNNKQLVVSTYGTEGKVYLLPMINPGSGDIDQGKIKTFGGFGRISAIATQQ